MPLTDYTTMPVDQQLALIAADCNSGTLAAKASMWHVAAEQLTQASDEFTAATNRAEAAYGGVDGEEFVARSRESNKTLLQWRDAIVNSQVAPAIQAVADAIQPTFANVSEHKRLKDEALRLLAETQAAAQAAQGVGQPFIILTSPTYGTVNASTPEQVEQFYAREAGAWMNRLGDLYLAAGTAVEKANANVPWTGAEGGAGGPGGPGGPAQRNAGTPGGGPSAAPGGGPSAVPGGGPAGALGADQQQASAGEQAQQQAGAGGAGAGAGGAGAGAGGAGAGAGGAGAGAGGAGAGGAGAGAGGAGAGGAGGEMPEMPQMPGGPELSGGPQVPTLTPPHMPPTTVPPNIPSTTWTPPTMPPPALGGLGGLGGFGGGGGGFGGGAGGIGGGGAGAAGGGARNIPAAAAPVAGPANLAPAKLPPGVAPGITTAGSATGAGGGMPPMMPPMGGHGMGAGGGDGGSGPGSGAAKRPTAKGKRRDEGTPGLLGVLAGRSGAPAAAGYPATPVTAAEIPATLDIVDEDLWQPSDTSPVAVDRPRRYAN